MALGKRFIGKGQQGLKGGVLPLLFPSRQIRIHLKRPLFFSASPLLAKNNAALIEFSLFGPHTDS